MLRNVCEGRAGCNHCQITPDPKPVVEIEVILWTLSMFYLVIASFDRTSVGCDLELSNPCELPLANGWYAVKSNKVISTLVHHF